tara:strand:- start:866 stop:1252 length:387 start_codon:yes stop_codon:yes gene_type:complete
VKRYLIFLSLIIISCSAPHKNDFSGVWQYVSGRYTSDDSTTETNSNDIKSIKIFSGNYYSLITQIVSSDNFFAHSGLYNLDGDSYTESFKMHKNPEMIGKSETFKYQMKNNQLIISNEFIQEVWEKIE